MEKLTSPVKRVMVTGSRHQQQHLGDIADLFRCLLNEGIGITVERRFLSYLRSELVDIPESVRESDILPSLTGAVISIGGDGTFLRSAQIVRQSGVPILGVNTGHLGFLASFTLHDRREIASALSTGTGVLSENRSLLAVECGPIPDHIWPYALNEVAVLKADTASMVTVRAEVDGTLLADYRADGLVVATATGSTAYNLSAGGPLLDPTLSNIVLSPLAPHTLTMRPIVLSADCTLHLTVESRSPQCRVSLDGRSFTLRSGESLKLHRAPFSIKVIRRSTDDFASILRNKLLWGAR